MDTPVKYTCTNCTNSFVRVSSLPQKGEIECARCGGVMAATEE